ncbi:MAG: hypothetical protein HRU15_04225 [Planctomycetes bacterium]|nr:hypothetical protein [Planctomycetota bacterium]
MKINKKKILLIGGVTIGVLTCTYIILMIVASSQVNSKYQALKDAGYPMTAAELTRDPIDDADNAAHLYEAAQALLKSVELEKKAKRYVSKEKRLSAENVKIRTEIIESPELQGILPILNSATNKSSCQFIENYPWGPIGRPTGITKLMMGQIPFYLDALFEYHFERGNIEESQRALYMSLVFALRLGEDPYLISHMVSLGKIDKILPHVRTLAERNVVINDDLLALLNSTLLEKGFVRTLHGERVLCVDWYYRNIDAMSKEMRWSAGINSFASALYDQSPFSDFEYAGHLNSFLVALKDQKNPLVELSEWEDTEWLHNINNSRLSSVEGQANMVICKTGIALFAYRNKHGHFPEDLEKLADVNFIDPFNNKPLIYSKSDTGFTLASVGSHYYSIESGKNPKWVYEKKSQ